MNPNFKKNQFNEMNLGEFKTKLKQDILKQEKYPGLHKVVISSLESTASLESLRGFKLKSNFLLEGKTRNRNIEIYVEFEGMKNIERTIIKTVENREVTEEDVEELYNIKNDLHILCSTIIYFNTEVSEEALMLSQKMNIKLKYFDWFEEILKFTSKTIKMILPEEHDFRKDILKGGDPADPFWIIMGIDSNNNTQGTYYQKENKLVLFLSKKQAVNFKDENLNNKYNVFGLSQTHLRVLGNLMNNGLGIDSRVLIYIPNCLRKASLNDEYYSLTSQELIRYYWRG